jgi:hypothetical protein
VGKDPKHSSETNDHSEDRDIDSPSRDTARMQKDEHAGKGAVSDTTSGTSNSHGKLKHHVRGKSEVSENMPVHTSNAQHLLAERENDLRALERSYQSLENELRLSRNDVYRLRQERNEVQEGSQFIASRYQYIIDKCLQPFAQHLGTEYNDTDGKTMEYVLLPLCKEALEAQSLRKETKFLMEQIQVLQKEMLANVDKVQAVSDQQFEQDFRALAAAIKEMSRMIRFTDKVDIVEALGQPYLLENVASHHMTGRGQKKCFVEALVWSVLVHLVFRGPFKIFGSDRDMLGRTWKELFGSGFFLKWPNPTVLSETWRHTSAEHLLQMVSSNIYEEGADKKAKGTDKEARRTKEDSIHDAHEIAVNFIEEQLAKATTGADITQIQEIVNKSFALAMKMSLQRARIQVTFPAVGAQFAGDQMKSAPAAGVEELDDGIVTFIVNSGLTKWGDALGKNLEHRYDIVPALVQLESGDLMIL